MTVVLTIRCRDGIVLGADGQSTTGGHPAFSTRGTVRKVFDVDGRLAWGAAGGTGLCQTLEQQLRQDVTGQLDQQPEEVRRLICTSVHTVQVQADQQAAVPPMLPPEILAQHVQNLPTVEGVFCWHDNADEPHILSVPQRIAGHNFLSRFGAAGSGTTFANFAMTSVSHLNTPNLDLEEAKMVVYRTIDDMTQIASYGIGHPINLYTVSIGEGAVFVAEDEVRRLADSMLGWKERQRTSLGPLAGPDATDPESEPVDDPGLEAPRA